MEKKAKILFIVKLVSTILTGGMGILLIAALGDIYFASPDNDPFNTASISAHSPYFITVLVLFLVVLCASILSAIFLPKEKRTFDKRGKQEFLNQLRYYKESSAFKEEEKKEVAAIQKKRHILLWITSIVSFALFVFPLAYVCNPAHFSAYGDLASEAIALAIHTLPFLLVIYILFLIYSFLNDKELEKEIKLYRKLPLKKEKSEKDEKKEKLLKTILQASILVLAITFILVGAVRGEAESVMAKAINICTECIGLG